MNKWSIIGAVTGLLGFAATVIGGIAANKETEMIVNQTIDRRLGLAEKDPEEEEIETEGEVKE